MRESRTGKKGVQRERKNNMKAQTESGRVSREDQRRAETEQRERENRRTEKEIAKTRRQRKQRATAPESIMIFHTCFGQKVQALYQYLK